MQARGTKLWHKKRASPDELALGLTERLRPKRPWPLYQSDLLFGRYLTRSTHLIESFEQIEIQALTGHRYNNSQSQ